MHVFSLGGWSAKNGPKRSTNTGAGIPCTVRTSVDRLAYLHRKRFSTSTQHSFFDTDDLIASAARQERLLSVGRKRKVPKDAEDRLPMYLKWQLLIDPDEYQPRAPTNGDGPQPTPS